MDPQPTAVQLQIAHFLCEVVRASAAWSVFHDGEPIVIHAEREDILLLWSSPESARFHQRRSWPRLATGEIPLGGLLTHFLPTAHEHRIAIGIGGSKRGDPVVTIPADWLERALRAGLETGWRPTAPD